MGRGASDITGIEIEELEGLNGRLFATRHYECVTPPGTVFANAQDKEIYELRATGLELFNALLDKVPVPDEVRTRSKEGRKIAERYEDAWFSKIRKSLDGSSRYPHFQFNDEKVEVLLIGGRHLFDVVLWYRGVAYTGNFKVTEKGGDDNIFGSGGFSYLLAAPGISRGKGWAIELTDLPGEEQLALAINRWNRSGGQMPEPREYFLISHNRKTKEDRVVPVTAMTSHISAPTHNTLQGRAHQATIDLTRPWKESWEGMAALLTAHAEKRALMFNLIEHGVKRFCAHCAKARFGNFCNMCQQPLVDLPAELAEKSQASDLQTQIEIAEAGF